MSCKNNYGNGLSRYFFDGIHPAATWHRSWFSISSIPSVIEEEVSQPNINYRYVLIDDTMKSDRVPLEFTRDEVTEGERCERRWKDEYAHLQSLYVEVSDKQPNIRVSVDFSIEVIMELDEIREWNRFSYPTTGEHDPWVTDTDARHDLIDSILFPEIVLPARPCTFTSEQVYRIIREHVRSNIDGRYAIITSDYDFCFTVKKRIALREPVEWFEETGKGRRARRVKRYRTDRQVTVFEMTHEGHNYRGYTPVRSIAGENIEDLKSKMDAVLEGIMREINKPVKDCPHCDGTGVVIVAEERIA